MLIHSHINEIISQIEIRCAIESELDRMISPAEYFGPTSGHGMFISQNLGPQIPTGYHLQHSHEGGLNILANGAVAASVAPPQGGYPYPSNTTDNYGYIVQKRGPPVFLILFYSRDLIIELLIIILVKDILKLHRQLPQLLQISPM